VPIPKETAMPRSFVRSRRTLAPLAALSLLAAPLAAQRAPTTQAKSHPSILDVTPYAGYMMFGHYLDGPLGTSVRSANAPVAGAQLGMALSENLSLVGNVAYGSADLQVGVPILGGIDVGTSKHWVYDANLEYRLPTAGASRTLTPFFQAGAGAITTKLQNGILHTSATNAAFNGGAGLDFTLGKGLGARLMVKDYIGRFDAEDETGLPIRGDVTHNVAGSLGLRLSF
jgi:hypothetical protein